MATKTSIRETARRKGQLRIDQQRAARKVAKEKAARKATGSQMTKAEAEAFAKGTKKVKKKIKKGAVSTVGGVANLLKRQRKQREAIFE